MICPYCLQLSSELTKDHVFAGSWYPANTPTTVQRWTVKACETCNNAKSLIEEYMFLRWSPGLNPEDPEYAPLTQKAERARSPQFATSDDDRAHRESVKRDFFNDLVENPPLDKGFPNLQDVKSDIGIKFSAEKTHAFQRLLIRGAVFKQHRRYIALGNDSIQVFNVVEGDNDPVLARFRSTAKKTDIGNGFRIEYQHDPDAGMLYSITIWNLYRFYAFIPKEALLASELNLPNTDKKL